MNSVEATVREISHWFKTEELANWKGHITEKLNEYAQL